MEAITLEEFNIYIRANRFISGNEIAWFKSNEHLPQAIGTIIECFSQYQAMTYQKKQKDLYCLGQFRKFNIEKEARDFLEKELNAAL